MPSLKGNRTRLTALITAALVAADRRWALNIPVEVYSLLGFLIVHYLRAGFPETPILISIEEDDLETAES